MEVRFILIDQLTMLYKPWLVRMDWPGGQDSLAWYRFDFI